MICDTRSISGINAGMEEVFQMKASELEKAIDSLSRYVCTDETIILSEIHRFVLSTAKVLPDEIEIAHMGRHITSPKRLLCVHDLLTSMNECTLFLATQGIEFKLSEKGILLIYDGKSWGEKEIENSNLANGYKKRLLQRLGYEYSDMCVNGFILSHDIKKHSHSYYESLREGPELFRDLDKLLGTSIANNFRKLSTFEISYYRCDFEDVFWRNNRDKCPEKRKTEFIEECLKTLVYEKTEGSHNYSIAFASNDRNFDVYANVEF